MIFKRIVSAITCTAVLASSLSVFSGCSMKEFFANPDDDTAAAESGVLTNGDWLKMVNDAFGMQVDESKEDGELEAAKEWGIVGEDEKIDQNAPVDDQFIASTLTKAAGYVDSNATAEEIAQAAVAHDIITSEDAKVSNPEEAIQALAHTQQDWAHQIPEEHRNIELAENVQNFNQIMNVNDAKISGDTVNIPTAYASSLNRDDVFILPKDESGQGGAYKVVYTTENGDGTTTIKCVPASVEEIYKKIDVSGRFAADMDNFESSNSDVTVLSKTNDEDGGIKPLGYSGEEGTIQQLDSATVKSNEIEFSMDMGDFDVVASISDVKLTTDIDWDFGLVSGFELNRIFMTVDYKTKIGIKCGWEGEKSTGDLDIAKAFLDKPSIEVGKVAVYICPGISVNLRVALSLEASGELSISVTTENCKGFELKGGNFRTINETSQSAEIGVSGEVGAYLTLTLALSLDYAIGEVDLLSLRLKVGPTLKASATFHSYEEKDDLLCLDVTGYLKIEVSLNLLETILKLFDFDASIVLVECDENNSPVKWNGIHIENFRRVDHCTADEEEGQTTTTAAAVASGILEIDNSYISLEQGATGKIRVVSVPEGYKVEDLIWTTSDSSRVTVDSNGNIKAVSSGPASITVKTKDGQSFASCVVNVTSKIQVTNNEVTEFGISEIAA